MLCITKTTEILVTYRRLSRKFIQKSHFPIRHMSSLVLLLFRFIDLVNLLMYEYLPEIDDINVTLDSRIACTYVFLNRKGPYRTYFFNEINCHFALLHK